MKIITPKAAYTIGANKAREISNNGDFTKEEQIQRDLYISAFHEIEQNHRQYACNVAELFKDNDLLWDCYEQGLSDGLEKILAERF